MEIPPHKLALHRRPFYVKLHDARGYLHYDLRLEFERVLLSWALPKGMSYDPGVRCDAIEVEDHRREYGAFEGVHESGTIMLWDRGMWEPHSECVDVSACLRKGVLRFTLYGEKLKGGWMLTRTRSSQNTRTVWKISKEPDSFARSKDARSILEEAPYSVSTGRTLEEIERDWGQGQGKGKSGPTLF